MLLLTVWVLRGGVRNIDQQLGELKEEMLHKYNDVFVDELTSDNRIKGEPIRLEVMAGDVKPVHCWSPASVSIHHERKAR